MEIGLKVNIKDLCCNEMLVSTFPTAPTCAPGAVSVQKAFNRDTSRYFHSVKELIRYSHVYACEKVLCVTYDYSFFLKCV